MDAPKIINESSQTSTKTKKATKTEMEEETFKLEFSDAPKFISRPTRLDLKKAIELSDNYRIWFGLSRSHQSVEHRCREEFIL